MSEAATVYRRWEDGYLVRAMCADDAIVAQTWFSGIVPTSCDLQVALASYPPGSRGFYVGELHGQLVASVIRIPVADGIYYGSYYYVIEKHRKKGFGKRLRDEVAAEHVGNKVLCIDAHDDLLEMNKRYGYTESFRVSRFMGRTPIQWTAHASNTVVKVHEVDFEDLIHYDNQCFVKADSSFRRSLLAAWTTIEGGSAVAALDDNGAVVGYGCRRPAFQPGNHILGPLYADTYSVAYLLVRHLCQSLAEANIMIDMCLPNTEAVHLAAELGLREDLKMIRMHLNGDPQEFNPKVFGLTSIDVCGF